MSDRDQWLELRVRAEMYEDLQKTRVAITNRAERGGVDPTLFKLQLEDLGITEDEFKKALRAAYRRAVPVNVRNWQKEATGVGEHLLARLLGVIGHPIHTTMHEQVPNPDYDPSKPAGVENPKRLLVHVGEFDRSLSQLRAYCGHGDPTRKRRKGSTQEEALAAGNPRAKMLVHLLAESAMKTGKASNSPYRQVYDQARELYSGRVDSDGKAWSLLHQHNAALRKVAKEILKDLWLAAK